MKTKARVKSGRSNHCRGIYTPKNPNKYRGNVSNIQFMSSWELKFFQFLDNNPNILEWSSEEIAIPYLKPTTGRVHKYYVDCFIKYRDKYGDVKCDLIEIKPEKQTKPSKARNQKTRLHENLQYAINESKWRSAALYAKSKGWGFKILTENMLFK